MNLESLPNLQKNILLAPYTTYKLGGPADFFLSVSSKDELVNAVREARNSQIPYFILGTGANILISDKGVRGLVIHNQSKQVSFTGSELIVESGAVISELITQTAQMGLSGLEHFAGIPSTVGGAIWQNLHFLSPDRERTIFIAEIVKKASLLDEHGKILDVPVEFFQFGYDTSILHRRKELVVLDVSLQLSPLEVPEIERRIAENKAWRDARHPKLSDYPSSGSIFKKIEGVGAGRLIQQVGMKGFKLGGVQVSEQHANFLVNCGNATATDIRDLIVLVQEKVKEGTGYELEAEISLVGEW